MTSSARTFVIDANVLFSFLISGHDHYLRFIIDNKIYLPDFALEEVQLYQERIMKRTRLDKDTFGRFTLAIFDNLTIVPNMLVSTQSYYQAFSLCRFIDPKDVSYVALAIEMNVPLLTRDKPLAMGLRQQGFATVMTLDELFQV